MSYILDALRRADAERVRGSVPGLHAQTVPPGSAGDSARPGVNPLVWMGLGAGVVVAAALAWTMSGSDAPPPVEVAVAPPAVTAPPPAPPTPALVLAPAPAVVAPAPTAQPAAASRKPSPVLGTARPVDAQRASANSTASAAAERVYSIAELPENVRRELPPMAIGGSIYSETPASRFLIINGQIYHEGDKVANDLKLEEIRLKAAVLRFRTYRVGITY